MGKCEICETESEWNSLCDSCSAKFSDNETRAKWLWSRPENKHFWKTNALPYLTKKHQKLAKEFTDYLTALFGCDY